MNIIKRNMIIGGWGIKYCEVYSPLNYFNFPDKIDAFSINNASYINNYIFKYSIRLLDKISNLNNFKTKLIYTQYDGLYKYEIYEEKNKFLLWCLSMKNGDDPILAYNINRTWNEWTLIYDKTNTNGKYAFEYFSKIFSYSVINYNALIIHGTLIEYNNKGIIISAPSGTGKTTHARMWRDTQRALIINGDRALCRKIDNKWIGFGMPWCGTSGEYINRDIEISDIVVLEQAKENSVEKLDTLQAFNHMIQNITAPTWEKNLLNKAMDYLEDIVNEVPVYKLKCTPDIEAVEVLKKEIDKL